MLFERSFSIVLEGVFCIVEVTFYQHILRYATDKKRTTKSISCRHRAAEFSCGFDRASYAGARVARDDLSGDCGGENYSKTYDAGLSFIYRFLKTRGNKTRNEGDGR